MIPKSLQRRTVPIDTLVPYRRNPRLGDVKAIQRSLEIHGQYRPIVVRKSDNLVLAGNHTLAAARQLGWKEIAAVLVDVDDEQAQQIMLADNRTADLGVTDSYRLPELLKAAGDPIGTGYTAKQVEDLMAEAGGDIEWDLPDQLGIPTGQANLRFRLGEFNIDVDSETYEKWQAELDREGGTPELMKRLRLG